MAPLQPFYLSRDSTAAVPVVDVKSSGERQYLHRRGGPQCVRQIDRVRRTSQARERMCSSSCSRSPLTIPWQMRRDSYGNAIVALPLASLLPWRAQFLVKRGFVVLSLSNAIRSELKARGIKESRQALMDMVRPQCCRAFLHANRGHVCGARSALLYLCGRSIAQWCVWRTNGEREKKQCRLCRRAGLGAATRPALRCRLRAYVSCASVSC